MTCKCNDCWLNSTLVGDVLANLLSCFVAIHLWHVAVHENKFVALALRVHTLDPVDCFEAVAGSVYVCQVEGRQVLLSDQLEHHPHSFDVVRLVVHNQYSACLVVVHHLRLLVLYLLHRWFWSFLLRQMGQDVEWQVFSLNC